MIPLVTREASREVDRDAVERLGLPTLLLMENAARGALHVLLGSFSDKLRRVLVVAGPGQNGGDGFALARHLIALGYATDVVTLCAPEKLRGDAKTNCDALQRLGTLPELVTADTGIGGLRILLGECSLIVDAMFGTGLDRPVTGLFGAVIEAINLAARPVVALDLPSGVDADNGAILGVAVRADATVTFGSHKRGLHQFPGAGLTGDVTCVELGVPAATHSEAMLVEPEDVAAAMPARPGDIHKGAAGHVLVVGGSPGKTGAALLSGWGAARSGAGLVTIASGAESARALDAKVVEMMTFGFDPDPERAVEQLMSFAPRVRAVALGPGLGTDETARKIAVALAVRLPVPTVLDADALNAIAGDLERVRHAEGPRVLTPHPAEAARLLGESVAQVQANRFASALRLAKRTGAIVALKGARTVVASPDGEYRICRRGTPALGAGGTGDVLTGIIATLLASHAPLLATAAGVVLHAMAAELAAQSDRGLFAREVADHVPAALTLCRKQAGTQL